MTELQTLELVVTSVMIPLVGCLIWMLKHLVNSSIRFTKDLLDYNETIVDKLAKLEHLIQEVHSKVC